MGDPRLALIFAWHGALRGALIYVSRVIFASMGKFLVLVVVVVVVVGVGVGRWAIILWASGTFLIFPNFLRS